MNPHLKQLWAAMRLPENFKKSYKFFCRGLDIRVAEIMKSYPLYTRPLDSGSHTMFHMRFGKPKKSFLFHNSIQMTAILPKFLCKKIRHRNHTDTLWSFRLRDHILSFQSLIRFID